MADSEVTRLIRAAVGGDRRSESARVLLAVRDGEPHMGEIAERAGCNLKQAMAHVNRLRLCGLVRGRRHSVHRGHRNRYRLNREGIHPRALAVLAVLLEQVAGEINDTKGVSDGDAGGRGDRDGRAGGAA